MVQPFIRAETNFIRQDVKQYQWK